MMGRICFLILVLSFIIGGCSNSSPDATTTKASSDSTTTLKAVEKDSLCVDSFHTSGVGKDNTHHKENEAGNNEGPSRCFIITCLIIVFIVFFIIAYLHHHYNCIEERRIEEKREKDNKVNNIIKNELDTVPKEVSDNKTMHKSYKEKDVQTIPADNRVNHIKTSNEIPELSNRVTYKRKIIEHPKEKVYVYLTVYNRALAEADEDQIVYYRAWKEDNSLYFEFLNNERTPMAINNRSFIIEAFCDKIESSKSPNESSQIKTEKPGKLTMDYKLISKAKIKYI